MAVEETDVKEAEETSATMEQKDKTLFTRFLLPKAQESLSMKTRVLYQLLLDDLLTSDGYKYLRQTDTYDQFVDLIPQQNLCPVSPMDFSFGLCVCLYIPTFCFPELTGSFSTDRIYNINILQYRVYF